MFRVSAMKAEMVVESGEEVVDSMSTCELARGSMGSRWSGRSPLELKRKERGSVAQPIS
jgi:hypothetical protein